MTVKTKHVQKFLQRCQQHYIRRGDKHWCSQTLAMIREELTHASDNRAGATQPLLLLTDCESRLELISPRRTTAIECQRRIQAFLGGIFNGSGFRERYPRLVPYLDEAMRQAGPKVHHVLPDVAVTVHRLPSLLAASLDGSNHRGTAFASR